MRCPKCRKAIPDGSEKHPDCGWGYEEPATRTYTPPYEGVSHAEARAAYLRNRARMESALRGPRIKGREVWQRILERHARGEQICSIAIRWAKEVLGQDADAAKRREVARELEARGVVTVEREPGSDDE